MHLDQLSPVETILLILGVFYAAECFAWLPRGRVLFAPVNPGRGRMRTRFAFLENDRGGLALAGVLPSTGFTVCETSPQAGARKDDRALDAVRSRVEEYRRQTDNLRWSCTLLCVQVFVVAPALYYFYPVSAALGRVLLAYFGVLAAFWGITLFDFVRAHRRLYPERRGERYKHLAIMAVSPAAAMRAVAVVSKHLLEAFDPLAVGAVLCRPEHVRAMVKKRLLELSSDGAEAAADDRRALMALVQAMGLDPEELTRPPNPEEGCISYCPRCQRQYVIREGLCSDCRVGLVAFDVVETA